MGVKCNTHGKKHSDAFSSWESCLNMCVFVCTHSITHVCCLAACYLFDTMSYGENVWEILLLGHCLRSLNVKNSKSPQLYQMVSMGHFGELRTSLRFFQSLLLGEFSELAWALTARLTSLHSLFLKNSPGIWWLCVPCPPALFFSPCLETGSFSVPFTIVESVSSLCVHLRPTLPFHFLVPLSVIAKGVDLMTVISGSRNERIFFHSFLSVFLSPSSSSTA